MPVHCCARAIEQARSQVVYDETIEGGFHRFVTKLSHSLQLSVRSALRIGVRKVVIFFAVKPKTKFPKQNKTKQQSAGKS